ncbi:density-regulated protein DRP1 [Spizellomyces punctatus DAOM BR117]|uniref:Translation machinery-associated protein 22 n=1 Tax=Spizellomyces punctatus (strain DAOM BR117) TaxID=645134 RepID=A0A0L0H6H9_SPIPD|nr:density-regulated protein DRP1 [Spizellomyces punctatus DAOM BR117]KNC97075.1 density-regulated protein DRP1 [Spizellomyces punctatus DAOM BR117]|eukprot:XP_016605115.1 density-regulated protein DRP1 [Spizellomyces punctatus DAOM BR117]
MSDTEDVAVPVEDWPKTRVRTDIVYCGVCSMPVEYCEFSGTTATCKKWLRKEHPTEFARIWPEDDLEKKMDDVTLQDDEVPDKELTKEQKKAEAKAERERKKKAAQKVIIRRVERTKRKCVIEVSGLENFGVDLKKAAKLFATKFACGSSVTKNPQGLDEIVVQGDMQDAIYELILKTWKEVPEDQMELTEAKKK